MTLLLHKNAVGARAFQCEFVVCPNPKCKKFTLTAKLFDAILDEFEADGSATDLIQTWNLIPPSKAKVFPDYIPKPICNDYTEACLIASLSPRASATLARRCLQGMIRDFFGVTLPTLKAEIDAIHGKVDESTWNAIEGVRKIGNIGAHMGKDINVIVDVEPNEAELLVGLIEFLIKDWYVARENKKQHLAALIGIAAQKDAAKKTPATVAS